jgi:hypothetical protein
MADKAIIVNDLSWCEVCNQSFNPTDPDSPNGEYFESCEDRTAKHGPFPPDLPQIAVRNPHAFCSAECEQEACDEVRLGRIEMQRMYQEGEIEDTPRLDMDSLGSYSI